MARKNDEKLDAEKFYDKHAKTYSTGDFPSGAFDEVARTALRFADDITWHFILKYAPRNKGALILEAGAGDGHWGERLLERGYNNLVISDLSQAMLEQAQNRLVPYTDRNLQFVKADITNMREFKANTFDYVFSQYDAVSYSMKPQEAMNELARIAKNGTYIVVCLDTKFRRVPEFIEAGQIDAARKLLETNISQEFAYPQYNLCWEELAENFETAGLHVEEVVGAPVFVHQVKETILKELENDPRIRNELLKMELEYCTTKSLVNFAGHLQMIGRKAST
ncbi:MAG: class I SAM-dependent methyltransferase [Candidatus Heimdallarchaeota archaeon]